MNSLDVRFIKYGGRSLLELLMVISMIVVLLGLTTQHQNMLSKHLNMSAHSEVMVSSLKRARTEAVYRQKPVLVTYNNDKKQLEPFNGWKIVSTASDVNEPLQFSYPIEHDQKVTVRAGLKQEFLTYISNGYLQFDTRASISFCRGETKCERLLSLNKHGRIRRIK